MTRPIVPTSRDRRALVIGACVVALAALVRGVPLALDRASRAAATAQVRADRAAYAQRMLASLPAMRDSLVARSLQLDAVNATLIRAGSPARVSADLSALVSRAARDVGLDLFSSSATSDSSTESPLLRAELHLDAQGDIAGVMQFLLLLELSPGLLDIREFALSQPDPAAPSNRPEQLRLTLTIDGVARRVAQRIAPAVASGAAVP